MNAILMEVARGVLVKVIESAAGAAADRMFGRVPANTPRTVHSDPVAGAQAVMDGFLQALADRNFDALPFLVHPEWAEHPDTEPLMTGTINAAPPVSWGYRDWHAPDGWQPGMAPGWLYADLVVTFDLGDGRFDTIPAALRAVDTDRGWLVDYLAWGNPMEAQPQEGVGDFFSHLFPGFSPPTIQLVEEPTPTPRVLECAGCGQKMRVPTDKGRLRVTCPRCRNSQWYTP